MDFFNGLGKKFSQAARSVQEKTRDSVESTRLAGDLRSAKNELETRYTELGRAYYNTLTDKEETVPQELIDAVRDTLKLIADLTAQRDRIHQQIRCPGCGAVQSEEARFCSNCGKRMPEEMPAPAKEPEPEIEEAYCAMCGAMRHGQSKFCAVCGHAYGTDLPVAVQEKNEPESPYAEPLEEPVPSEISE